MIETLTALLAVWGYALIAVFNAVGRCGVPLPSSVLMILAGALVVGNAAELMLAISVAYLSALAGDLMAYRFGRFSGAWLDRLAERRPKVGPLLARSHALAKRYGAWAVLFTRWPLSTLGPYVNLAAGAVGLSWRHFFAFCSLGELVWVSLYLSLGYIARHQLPEAIDGASQATLIGGIVVLGGALLWWRATKRRRTLSDGK